MTTHSRQIFRTTAVQRYLQNRQDSVLPRIIAPRTFTYLWACLGLLGVSSIAAWSARIPIYVSGSAIVVNRQATKQDKQNEVIFLAFFPPHAHTRLQIGQSLLLQFDTMSDRIRRDITEIEPNLMSPVSVQQQFSLSSGTAHAITQPSAIAIAPFEPLPNALPATTYIGSVYPVDVEIGSRRAISLLPFVGSLLGE